MTSTRLLVPAAVLGLVTSLAAGVGPATAAEPTCGTPVWDLDHDGRTDAVAAAGGHARVVYGDDLRYSSTGLAVPDLVDGEYTPRIEAFASISLADSDADTDYCSLVAVGVPDATVDGVEGAGLVHVFRVVRGSDNVDGVGSTELDDELLFTITQANDGLDATEPTTNAHFGASLAAYDQTSVADGPTPLAIGAPGEDVDGVTDAGSVAVVTLSKSGEVTAARRATRAPGKGLSTGSALGSSLTADRGLVVAGAPGRTISGRVGAGSVLLIPGAAASPVVEVSQATSGVQGSVEKGDGFGRSVASTWNPTLARHEIAIGIPGEDVGSVVDAGQVTTLRSTDAGKLSTIASFTQNTAGVLGSSEKGDKFGYSVAPIERPGKASAWLLGLPFENTGSKVDSGEIHTLGETKNRAWKSDAVLSDGVFAGFRFGEHVLGPRGDRGPVWSAQNPKDDAFAGTGLPGWGTLREINEDAELEDFTTGPIGG